MKNSAEKSEADAPYAASGADVVPPGRAPGPRAPNGPSAHPVAGAVAAPVEALGFGSLAVAAWGVAGVLLLLSQAVWRLTPLAWEPIRDGSLTPALWLLWTGWVLFQCWAEGYKGFQKAFSPRVVARAFHLARNPAPIAHVVLAPLFCLSFFHATRKRLVFSYAFVLAIVALVVVVHQFPQPWRGIIDAGVVVGLVWGMAAIVGYFARALAGRPLPVPADVPDRPA